MQYVPPFFYISNEHYSTVVTTANPSVYQQVCPKNSFVLMSFKIDSWPRSRVFPLTFFVKFLKPLLKIGIYIKHCYGHLLSNYSQFITENHSSRENYKCIG